MILAALHSFLLLAPAFGGYVFPDDFQLCKAHDMNVNKCLLNAIRDALPKLATDGISSPIILHTEPFLAEYCEYHIRNVDLLYDEYFINLIHTGFINTTVESVSADTKNLVLNFTTFSPYVAQKSFYTANGTILYNGTQDPDPVWGTGISEKHLYNVTILHQLKINQVIKNREIYLKVSSYDTSIGMDLITLNYGNHYNGTNPKLSKKASDYINSNAMYLISGISKDIEVFFGNMFKIYANLILGSVPAIKIIPDFPLTC